MKNLPVIYVESLRLGLMPYFANWLPNEPLAVGDFGYLNGCMFSKKSSLKNAFRESLPTTKSKSKSSISYMSSKGVSVSSSASGSASSLATGSAPIKAHLEISFSKKGAVFFNAAKCEITTVKDPGALGKMLLQRFATHSWIDDWAVITSVVKADATTVLVSSSKNASAVLETDASVSEIDLADASIGLQIKSPKKVGFHIVAEAGCIPLFTLGKVKAKLFGEVGFEPRFLADGIELDTLRMKQEHVEAGRDIEEMFMFEELTEL